MGSGISSLEGVSLTSADGVQVRFSGELQSLPYLSVHRDPIFVDLFSRRHCELPGV
jgi:hypothetical protein